MQTLNYSLILSYVTVPSVFKKCGYKPIKEGYFIAVTD